MKKVLIISPHFAPVNAADMHRVRQSIQYYEENGWIPEVVMVDENFVEGNRDYLLNNTVPKNIKIHKVSAWSTKYTRKLGLGNIGLRALWNYKSYVNKLLKEKSFDLIFFSTTAYSICILGRYWKNKFNIPYIIDMQDPWRSDHYLNLPKNQQPPKFWFSYRLDSFLEKKSMEKVDGLLSVSSKYLETLKSRYTFLKDVPTSVVPFAAFEKDIEVAMNSNVKNNFFQKGDDTFNIVYIGRGGHDMKRANSIIFNAFKKGLTKYDDFKKIRFYFIGTSYNPNENAEKTIKPIADNLGIGGYVTEITTRIPYFESLKILSDSSLILIPGSDNVGYTASKVYSYIWLKRPILTVFHSSSSVNQFMNDVNVGLSVCFDIEEEESMYNKIIEYFINLIQSKEYLEKTNWVEFEKYTAPFQVKKQVELFNKVVN